MKFVIEIDCDNDAFQPDPRSEVAEILDNVRVALVQTLGRHPEVALETGEIALHDSNGNTVGTVQFTE